MSFRYNSLLSVISQSLGDIVKALKGLVVMSSELELMASSLFNNTVPEMWKAKARHTDTWQLSLLLTGDSGQTACHSLCSTLRGTAYCTQPSRALIIA